MRYQMPIQHPKEAFEVSLNNENNTEFAGFMSKSHFQELLKISAV